MLEQNWYKGVCNILLGMLCEVTSAKHAWVSLEKSWMGQMCRLEEKNGCNTLVLTAFILFDLFNVFHINYKVIEMWV
jgi:hypothetical protein